MSEGSGFAVLTLAKLTWTSVRALLRAVGDCSPRTSQRNVCYELLRVLLCSKVESPMVLVTPHVMEETHERTFLSFTKFCLYDNL